MLPAQAGVIPEPRFLHAHRHDAPRAGGGDPKSVLDSAKERICSPRRRG